MSFTLGDVKTVVQARGYGTDTDDAQTELVKAALRRLYGMRRWVFLDTRDVTLELAAGEDSLSILGLDDPVLHLDSVRLTDAAGVPADLEYRRPQVLYDARQLQGSDRVAPNYWTRKRDAILFDAAADQTYTVQLDYAFLPELPDADEAVIEWPDVYEDILVEAVCAELAYRQRDMNARAEAKVAYGERLREMIAEHDNEQRQTSQQVERWDGWDNLGFLA